MEEREAKRERSMNATPSMSRLNPGRAAVIMRVEGVSESVRGSGPEGGLRLGNASAGRNKLPPDTGQ